MWKYHDEYFSISFLSNHTHFTFLSSMSGGLLLRALSPIRVPLSLPVRDITSPVDSLWDLLSISDRSAWRTRLEFCNWNHWDRLWASRKRYVSKYKKMWCLFPSWTLAVLKTTLSIYLLFILLWDSSWHAVCRHPKPNLGIEDQPSGCAWPRIRPKWRCRFHGKISTFSKKRKTENNNAHVRNYTNTAGLFIIIASVMMKNQFNRKKPLWWFVPRLDCDLTFTKKHLIGTYSFVFVQKWSCRFVRHVGLLRSDSVPFRKTLDKSIRHVEKYSI